MVDYWTELAAARLYDASLQGEGGMKALISIPSAAINARSRSMSFEADKLPTKCVSCGFRRLTSSSQYTALSWRSPSSMPMGTCVERPSRAEYTGAHTTVENFESMRT